MKQELIKILIEAIRNAKTPEDLGLKDLEFTANQVATKVAYERFFEQRGLMYDGKRRYFIG